MPNYPGFYRKQYPIKNLNVVQLYNTKSNTTDVASANDQSGNRFLLQSPCEYFMFSVLMTIWFGGYVRRVLYKVIKNINKYK
tara:strand:+ start:9298 stop:9543 length:246 start_codon:yes stop_codon:yes gene_type:complete